MPTVIHVRVIAERIRDFVRRHVQAGDRLAA
jgi:hypothetical protein